MSYFAVCLFAPLLPADIFPAIAQTPCDMFAIRIRTNRTQFEYN